MIPTDEKVRAMVQRGLRALEADREIRVVDPDAARRAIKKGIETELDVLRAIEETARRKIASLSRRVSEGSREYDELFFKYVTEERNRRGI